MRNRDYMSDAVEVALDAIDDLRNVGPMTISELVGGDLSQSDIENIQDELGDIADALHEIVTGW